MPPKAVLRRKNSTFCQWSVAGHGQQEVDVDDYLWLQSRHRVKGVKIKEKEFQ